MAKKATSPPGEVVREPSPTGRRGVVSAAVSTALFLSVFLLSCSKRVEEQKLPPESAPRAQSIASVPATPPAPKKMDLRIKVGVVMKSGDVKPVARTDFVLGKLSLVKLEEEEILSNPPPTAEVFCKSQGFSPEMLDLLASLKWDLAAFNQSLVMAGMGNGLTVEQVARVPELKKPYDAGYAQAGYGMSDEQHERYALGNVFLGVEDKVKNLDSNYITKGKGNAYEQAWARAKVRIFAANPVVAKTSLTGEAVFREVPVGEYFISNVEYSYIGESGILWDLAVTVSEQAENYVELSNDNAWRVSQ